MQNALDTAPDIDADSKIKMMNFFRFKFSQFCICFSSTLVSAIFVVSLVSNLERLCKFCVLQAHCFLSCGWWWVEESKPSTSVQARGQQTSCIIKENINKIAILLPQMRWLILFIEPFYWCKRKLSHSFSSIKMKNFNFIYLCVDVKLVFCPFSCSASFNFLEVVGWDAKKYHNYKHPNLQFHFNGLWSHLVSYCRISIYYFHALWFHDCIAENFSFIFSCFWLKYWILWQSIISRTSLAWLVTVPAKPREK